MSWYRRLPRTSLRVRRTRSGFTLIELMVALALLVIVTMMAFSGFRYLTAVMNRTIATTTARENLSVVMDQLTKELREVTTVNDVNNANHPNLIATNNGSRVDYGVTLPASSDPPRGIADVLSVANYGILTSGVTYTFNSTANGAGNSIALEFFTVDSNTTPAKHRIRYSLTAAANGLAQQFWPDSHYEPCQIIYSNETYSSATSTWTGVTRQPVTGQVITNFTVIRPAWSAKVVQIVLQAMVKNGTGSGSTTITRIAQISLRQ